MALPVEASAETAGRTTPFAAFGTAAERHVQNGDSSAGRRLIAGGAYGCAACHVIPGIKNARGIVGPPLSGFATRRYIAGVLPNTPGNLIRFLQNSPAYAPETAMPNLGVAEHEAHDLAAFLYTLSGADAR